MDKKTPTVDMIQDYMRQLNKQRIERDEQNRILNNKITLHRQEYPRRELPRSEYHEKLEKEFQESLKKYGWGTKEEQENSRKRRESYNLENEKNEKNEIDYTNDNPTKKIENISPHKFMEILRDTYMFDPIYRYPEEENDDSPTDEIRPFGL